VVPSSILNAIISGRLVDSSCVRMLPGDGITTPDLTVKGAQRVFGAVLVDVRVARKSVHAMGETASAAKNLDEYQFMICSLILLIPDSNSSKMQLQKYHVAIIASFAKLMLLFCMKCGRMALRSEAGTLGRCWKKRQKCTCRPSQMRNCRSHCTARKHSSLSECRKTG
jgi:hypothetical protein